MKATQIVLLAAVGYLIYRMESGRKDMMNLTPNQIAAYAMRPPSEAMFMPQPDDGSDMGYLKLAASYYGGYA